MRTDLNLMTRREFIASAAAIAGSLVISGVFGGCTRFKGPHGGIEGASFKNGHKLINGGFSPPSKMTKAGVVIAGGGVAALSSAWHLTKKGVRAEDILMLELEPKPGGNAISGGSVVSAYPWGAHYVPIPDKGSGLVMRLFEEMGVIKGYKGGLPIYDENVICADLQERLYMNGVWQDGLMPQIGITKEDKRQYDRFGALMDAMSRANGNDRRKAFSIPIDSSSRDERFIALDRISMARFMQDRAFDSGPLLWYVDYCCRDDYGGGINEVSAWAGVHYFASRTGRAANAEPQAVLTWPDGNGRIARYLGEAAGIKPVCNALVYNVENGPDNVIVDYYDVNAGSSVRVEADFAIVALPRFAAVRAVRELRESGARADGFVYSPWVVANVTLKSAPQEAALRGSVPTAWDNVNYHSRSLGYIDSTHQTKSTRLGKNVITWYMPLDDLDPINARRAAINRTHVEWVDVVIKDLEAMHRGIRELIERIDVWVWGHGMIRPVPGFIWGGARQGAAKGIGRISFAHSDLSGISIFEEALYRGVQAAESAIKTIGQKKRRGLII